jgi:hypothetical protein
MVSFWKTKWLFATALLRPMHRVDVVLEVLCPLGQVSEVLVRQVDHPVAHIVLRQLDEKRAETIRPREPD